MQSGCRGSGHDHPHAACAIPAVAASDEMDRRKLEMPVFGPLNQAVSARRGTSANHQQPVLERSADRHCAAAPAVMPSATPASFRSSMMCSCRCVRCVSLPAALETADGFQRKLCSSIAVGEATGRLDIHVGFHRGFDGARCASRRASALMTILEPMLIVADRRSWSASSFIAVMSPIIGSAHSPHRRVRGTSDLSETCKPHKKGKSIEMNTTVLAVAGGAGACRGRQVRRAAFRAGALQCPRTRRRHGKLGEGDRRTLAAAPGCRPAASRSSCRMRRLPPRLSPHRACR